MNKRIRIRNSIALFALIAYNANSQGTFFNLDFEAANLRDLPSGQGEFVAVSNGVPGWAIFPQFPDVMMLHNSGPLGGAAVVIFGPDWRSDQILEGRYTVGLIHSTAGPPMDAGIEQTGQIPMGARSIQFYGGGFLTLSFAGQPIPLFSLGSGPNYTIFGGDVSAFAGQTGQLQFVGNALLDNISFSSQSIPEPSVFALSGLGALLLGWRCARGQRDPSLPRRGC